MSDDLIRRVDRLEYRFTDKDKADDLRDAAIRELERGHVGQTQQLALMTQKLDGIAEWTSKQDKKNDDRNKWAVRFVIGLVGASLWAFVKAGGLSMGLGVI